MIGLEHRSSIYVYARPTDMRKSFFTLADLVKREMRHDPLSGDAFVFLNKRRTMMKCLVFDGTGLRLTAKRLAKGRFASPWERGDDQVITMTAAELALFFDGSQLVFIGSLSPRPVGPERVVSRSMSV